MSSTKEYLEYILNQLSELDGLTYKPMMGEYLLYWREKLFGGIYDDRFLVKPVKAVKELLPEASYEVPYDGAKPMLMPDNTDDKELLAKLVRAMYEELPYPVRKKK